MAAVAAFQNQFECVIGPKFTRPKKGSSEHYHFVTLIGLGWSYQCMVDKALYEITPAEGQKALVDGKVCPIKAKVKRGDKEIESDVMELEVVAIVPRTAPAPPAPPVPARQQ
jgi:hypothetical protein